MGLWVVPKPARKNKISGPMLDLGPCHCRSPSAGVLDIQAEEENYPSSPGKIGRHIESLKFSLLRAQSESGADQHGLFRKNKDKIESTARAFGLKLTGTSPSVSETQFTPLTLQSASVPCAVLCGKLVD